MTPTWPYYTLTADGKLVDDDGNDAFPGQRFENMNITKQRSNYKKSHPISQNKHTGKWGFRRVNGCLNLKACVYNTKRQAELARSQASFIEPA